MNYVILDMEWNRPERDEDLLREPFVFDSEIIEIGAILLDEDFEAAEEYKTFVRPRFYTHMNGAVASLTKIRSQLLKDAPAFPEALQQFLAWCGEPCCLCTWGPTDAAVLLDNMLLHGLDTETAPWFCDLQRIFGREIMREERRCSLESAVELFDLKMDRAHDALNDARNTLRVCSRMDLAGCAEEYVFRYVAYGEDRAAPESERLFPTQAAALASDGLVTIPCPYCGETIRFGDWAARGENLLGYARCGEGDEYLCSLRQRRAAGGLLFSRRVREMSDDLWDLYQEAREKEAAE